MKMGKNACWDLPTLIVELLTWRMEKDTPRFEQEVSRRMDSSFLYGGRPVR